MATKRARPRRAAAPRLPPPDQYGNFPALPTITALLARDIEASRRALGLSQAELARRAGVRVETINRLEQGKHVPSVRTVEKIDRALKEAEAEGDEAAAWAAVYVLARKDPTEPYGPENCVWRPARNAKEAQMGLEEWFAAEPHRIPLTAAQLRQRAGLRSEQERRMFDIWARMLWRAQNQPEGN